MKSSALGALAALTLVASAAGSAGAARSVDGTGEGRDPGRRLLRLLPHRRQREGGTLACSGVGTTDALNRIGYVID